MDLMIPEYKSLFELTKRRLRGLKKIANKEFGELDDQDKFMFLIVGNINLRFNTICLLIENNNYDGIFALQRTIFELHLAFKSYMDSEDKNKFIELYLKKKNFETAIKWGRVITESNKKKSGIFTEEDQNITSDWKSAITEDLQQSINQSPWQTWYELATNKKIQNLSYEYLSEIDYFTSYDEPSNWVHPQRLEENMDQNFNQTLNKNYVNYLLGILLSDIKWLTDDINEIREYLKISKSNNLKTYFDKMVAYSEEIRSIYSKMITGSN
ncbi:DUF5677 domain-containing protein [Enterococcus sp. AZ152]|uniref:DUF5677 domain-containing protein n=1 Tax=Enterococcus sp. AZ152 TaxID=2774848 RepID=UPI003F289246